MTAKESRCSGHCCADFTLPFSPEQIKQRFLDARRKETPLEMRAERPRLLDPHLQDVDLVYPMLIHLGQYRDRPSFYVNPHVQSSYPGEGGEAPHHYTCKHYDKKTHNCTIYDVRPAMCREYPYRSECNYAACTWTARKAKKLPKPKARATGNDLVQLSSPKGPR